MHQRVYHLIRALFALLVLILSSAVLAVEPLAIQSDSHIKTLSLLPYIFQYQGAQFPTSIQQASALPDTDYAPLPKGNPLQPLRTEWFRLKIRNDSYESRAYVLDFTQRLFKEVNLRTSINGTMIKQIKTGEEFPRTTRDIDYDFFAFSLNVPANETLVVDFSINTPYAVLFMPLLIEENWFPTYTLMEGRMAGGVMGAIYSVALFLFVYILVFRRFGLEFQMWIFATVSLFSVMCLAGVFERNFFALHPEWNGEVHVLIHSLQGIIYAALLRNFYQTAKWLLLVDWVLMAIVCFDGLLIVGLFFINTDYLLVAMLISNVVLLLLASPLAVYALIVRRIPNVKLFSVGLLLFVGFVAYASLAAYGFLPVTTLSRYGYEWGVAAQVDFFFFGLVVRIFKAERESLVMERQVAKLNIEAEARSEFVSRVTHDIKSPLSAVMGAAQLIRNSSQQEQRDKYADIIQRSCSVVLSIVDGILSYAKAQAGKMVLHKKQIDIANFLKDIESFMEINCSDKPVQFFLTVADGVPPQLMMDGTQMYQLLNNLLSNAIKFTDEGKILLVVDVIKHNADSVLLRFVVQDTGIGMSEDFLLTAFEPYARETSADNYRPGFGLGLPTCKKIVELMGGTIEASSVPGYGSRFTVVLPVDLPQSFA